MRKIIHIIYNFLNANIVINVPLLNDNSVRMWGQNQNNIIEHYNSYLANVVVPNSPGPIEKHPYIDLYKDFLTVI